MMQKDRYHSRETQNVTINEFCVLLFLGFATLVRWIPFLGVGREREKGTGAKKFLLGALSS